MRTCSLMDCPWRARGRTAVSVLANDIVEEPLPFVREEHVQLLSFVLGKRSVLDAVESQFLQVGDVKVPCEEAIQVVESDAVVAHESWII